MQSGQRHLGEAWEELEGSSSGHNMKVSKIKKYYFFKGHMFYSQFYKTEDIPRLSSINTTVPQE